MVIAAGPAVNLVLAFVLLFVFFCADRRRRRPTPGVGAIEKGYPAAERARAGRPLIAVDGKRGDAERALARRSRRTSAPRARRSRAARRPRPATRGRSSATARERTVEMPPDLRPGRAERTRLGFAYAPGRARPLPFGESLDRTVDRFWFVTKATVELPGAAHQRRAAQGDLGRRRLLRGHAPDDPQRPRRGGGDPGHHLAVAGDREPVPVPAAGRRPHLLGDRREGARGRPVPFSVMERAGVVGFMLVILSSWSASRTTSAGCPARASRSGSAGARSTASVT